MGAHYSGSAASLAAVVTALHAACVAEGWTLNGDVLSKSGAFFRVWQATWGSAWPFLNGSGSAFSGQPYSDEPQIYIAGGTGVDGSNNLLGKQNAKGARLGKTFAGYGDSPVLMAFSLPVTYEIHISDAPDEVYLIVKHDGDSFQHIAFGHSPLAQATGGTGAWFGASWNPITNVNNGFSGGANFIDVGAAWSASGGSLDSWSYQSSAPLFFNWSTNLRGAATGDITSAYSGGLAAKTWHMAYHVHCDVDGVGWQNAGSSTVAFPHLIRGPNQLNGASPLLVPVATVARPSSKISMAAELAHARLCRIDNLNPEQIITLGTDKWKVYPFWKKNSSAPLGSNGSTIAHTGCLGWAVRYHGA